MTPKPITVYMCDDVFYGTFDRLVSGIQMTHGQTITYDEYCRERQRKEFGCEYYEAIIEPTNVLFCDYFIVIYEYNNVRNVTFMKTTGPDSECCFTIPKSKEAFIEEANRYFDNFSSVCGENIRVITTINEADNTIVMEDRDNIDLMTFTYMEPILLY